jgi:hypothetical protein
MQKKPCHSRAGGNPYGVRYGTVLWVPVCAGTTVVVYHPFETLMNPSSISIDMRRIAPMRAELSYSIILPRAAMSVVQNMHAALKIPH